MHLTILYVPCPDSETAAKIVQILIEKNGTQTLEPFTDE